MFFVAAQRRLHGDDGGNRRETFISKAAVAAVGQEKMPLVSSEAKNSFEKGTIKIAPGSPADMVRVFYKNLREKRFREAIMMTNLRASGVALLIP